MFYLRETHLICNKTLCNARKPTGSQNVFNAGRHDADCRAGPPSVGTSLQATQQYLEHVELSQ